MNILIVGAGPAGVTLSRRILELNPNCSVELIDAGPRVEQGNQRTWLDLVAGGRDPYAKLKDDKVKDQVDVGDRVLDISGSRYIGAGGSTNAWGGWCLRYRSEDFELKSRVNEGLDWPINYSELEPYYDRAEETLWVAGDNKPNPPLPYTMKDSVIINAFEKMGIEDFEHLPLARRNDCVTIGTCKYCPVLKRYVPQVDLEHSERNFANRFSLNVNIVATRIEMRSKSECVGVWVRENTKDSKEKLLEADVIVLALGAIESPKLLLSSQTTDWPKGIGNEFDHVGRHITAHPLVRVVGTKNGNPDNFEQPVDFPTLVCREFDTANHQERGKLLFVRDGRKNYIKLEEELKNGRSLSAVRNNMRKVMPFELRGFIEIFSEAENRVELASGAGSLGLPRTKVTFKKTQKTKNAIGWAVAKMSEILAEAGCQDPKDASYSTIRADHATSTCRMSSNDAEGVVDRDLRIYGTDNLYICSNAVMPNGAAVNPTLTLLALAERLADHLANSTDIRD